MLLESALADFSSDESRNVLGQTGAVPFSWEVMPGKPRSLLQSECSGEVSPAPSSPETTHQSDVSMLNLRTPSRHFSGELYSHPHRQYSGELLSKTMYRQYSGELFPQSRKQQRQHSSRHGNVHPSSSASQNSHSDYARQFSDPLDLRSPHRGSPSFQQHPRSQSDEPRQHRRTMSSAADEKSMHEKFSFDGEAAGAVSFEWEVQPERPKSDQSSSSRCAIVHHLQLPPSRLMLIKESDQAGCSNSSSPASNRSRDRNGHISPELRRQQEVSRKQQLHQGRYSGSPSSGATTPKMHLQHAPTQHHLKVYPGDIIRISTMGSFETSKNHSRNDSFNSVDSQDINNKYYEDESPVSTLERLPSPTGVMNEHELLSHGGSPADTPRRGSVARPNSSASASPMTEHDTRISVDSSAASSSRGGATLRCLPSFHSTSLHSSAPAASTSSSSNFMASCLVALEVALHSDREDSDHQDDSFVSLESGEHSRPEPSGRFSSRSPIHEADQQQRRRGTSHRWSAPHSQLEPEYHTMDFYSENGDDRYKLSSASATSVSSRSYSVERTSTEATSSPQSVVSTMSATSRPMGRHQNDPRRSLDEYSWKDRRFLQDRSSSWAEQTDDVCSNVSSECNLGVVGRHQEVYWDDQQSDMNSDRAEEVIRGAVDGLRFTYSPVSSAFVFTRPPNSHSSQFENGEIPENQVICFSPPNTVDTEVSQRFSISLDYATSVCSEDSLPYSVARSSDVTELGLSRAESWSKVARGATAVSAHQQLYRESASGLLDRRGYGIVLEEPGRDGCETPEADYQNAHTAEPEIRKRPTKKSGLATCLPFRSILRNFKAFSPGRSRLGPQCECNKQQQSQLNWTSLHAAQAAVSH